MTKLYHPLFPFPPYGCGKEKEKEGFPNYFSGEVYGTFSPMISNI